MKLKVLIIYGTFAPKRAKFFYQSLIDAVISVAGEKSVFYEAIPRLGLGDIEQSAHEIGDKYLRNSQDYWIIIGHSQGGMLASLLAIEYEAKVRAVIPIASPLAGTTWTDPINMPIRWAVESISQITRGKVRLRPKLRKLVAPIPIVQNLATHSDISEQILEYLAKQTSGHHTYSIVGLADMLVFPHRSAHPEGQLVHNYLIAPQSEYDLVSSHIPSNIEHICDKAGHMSIVNNPLVHALIAKIIVQHSGSHAQAS